MPGATWTWSANPPVNAGCHLLRYPNASLPLWPAKPGLSGGLVAQHGSGNYTPFHPSGYAFRNTSATTNPGAVTHVVVWNALPVLHDADRLTRCTVTVTPAAAAAGGERGASAAGGGAARGGSDPARRIRPGGSCWVGVPSMGNRRWPATLLWGGGGWGGTRFELVLYDSPILVVRADAMPPYDHA